jgi:hypothetical protein
MWFGQTNPSRLLINILKYFLFRYQIRPDIWLFMHSAYSQFSYRSIPCILSIWTDSFHIFSVHEHWNSVQRFTSFRIVSVDVQINPHILSIWTDSFRVFLSNVQIHSVYSKNAPKYLQIFGIELFVLQLLKGYYFKKVCMCAIGLKTYKG